MGGGAEHCRKIPLCQDLVKMPVLSPVLGEASMTGERSGSENMGRAEVCDDGERVPHRVGGDEWNNERSITPRDWVQMGIYIECDFLSLPFL